MQVYLVGGGIESDGSLLSSVEKFSVGDATWKTADNALPSARSYLAGIALNNEVFFIGTRAYSMLLFSLLFNPVSMFQGRGAQNNSAPYDLNLDLLEVFSWKSTYFKGQIA